MITAEEDVNHAAVERNYAQRLAATEKETSAELAQGNADLQRKLQIARDLLAGKRRRCSEFDLCAPRSNSPPPMAGFGV